MRHSEATCFSSLNWTDSELQRQRFLLNKAKAKRTQPAVKVNRQLLTIFSYCSSLKKKKTYLTFLLWYVSLLRAPGFEEHKILVDYKCISRPPSSSRNQLMVNCGEIISLQHASTTARFNLRLIMNIRENLDGRAVPVVLRFLILTK